MFINIMDSPYFTGDENNQEPILQTLKKMFPSREVHIKFLINMYKFCFPKKNYTLFEKTNSELVEDIQTTPITLNCSADIQEQTEALKKCYDEEKLFIKRLNNIPVFIDFAYLYYIWYYDSTAPIYKLPATLLKFNMIKNALEKTNADIDSAFICCIENELIRDLRIIQPPYMMRTELSMKDVNNKILCTIEPKCKYILNELLSLEKKLDVELSLEKKLDVELSLKKKLDVELSLKKKLDVELNLEIHPEVKNVMESMLVHISENNHANVSPAIDNNIDGDIEIRQ
mgnify:CR=1 FL=1